MAEVSFTAGSKVFSNVRLLPSLRGREIEKLSPLMIAFQRDGPQVLEKDIPRAMLKVTGMKGSLFQKETSSG